MLKSGKCMAVGNEMRTKNVYFLHTDTVVHMYGYRSQIFHQLCVSWTYSNKSMNHNRITVARRCHCRIVVVCQCGWITHKHNVWLCVFRFVQQCFSLCFWLSFLSLSLPRPLSKKMPHWRSRFRIEKRQKWNESHRVLLKSTMLIVEKHFMLACHLSLYI